MSDQPPIVDFSTPWSNLTALQAQRQMVQSVANDIRSSLRDVDRYEGEAINAANMAAVWAATLMVCDIVRIGLSAADKKAALAFSTQDRAIQSANRVLKLFGSGGIATKASLMKSIGPELEGAAKATDTLRKVAGELKKLKVPTTNGPVPVKIPKEASLLVDLGLAMAEDTILLLQAGNMQRQASVTAAQSRMQMRQNLQKVLNRIMLIDGEITREFERLRRIGNTA